MQFLLGLQLSVPAGGQAETARLLVTRARFSQRPNHQIRADESRRMQDGTQRALTHPGNARIRISSVSGFTNTSIFHSRIPRQYWQNYSPTGIPSGLAALAVRASPPRITRNPCAALSPFAQLVADNWQLVGIRNPCCANYGLSDRLRVKHMLGGVDPLMQGL